MASGIFYGAGDVRRNALAKHGEDERGKGETGNRDGAAGLSPESESERAPRECAFVRLAARDLGDKRVGGGGEGSVLSPCPDEMHFSATQKRRRAISRAEKYDFRAISWNNSREQRGNARYSGSSLRTLYYAPLFSFTAVRGKNDTKINGAASCNYGRVAV